MSLYEEFEIFYLEIETNSCETEYIRGMNCFLERRPTSSNFQDPWGCLGPDFPKLLVLFLLFFINFEMAQHPDCNPSFLPLSLLATKKPSPTR